MKADWFDYVLDWYFMESWMYFVALMLGLFLGSVMPV